METRKERRTLKHTFTQEELLALSEDLAVKNQDLISTENEKKSVTSQYGSKVNEIKEGIGVLSNKVANKFEHRDVDCEAEFHKPEQGIKTLTRGDTGEVFTEKMSDVDYDLFNQYQEELPDDGQDLAEGDIKVEVDGQPVDMKKVKALADGDGGDPEEKLDVDGKTIEKDPVGAESESEPEGHF